MKSKLILMAAVALALGGCNRHDADTQSRYSHLTGTETALITQPVVPDRGPVPSDANKACAWNRCFELRSQRHRPRNRPLFRPRATTPPEQVDVAAQDAAAKAPGHGRQPTGKNVGCTKQFANGEARARETIAAAPASEPPTHEEAPRQQ
jgi:hypothetical protein